jgi:hypothetical protein
MMLRPPARPSQAVSAALVLGSVFIAVVVPVMLWFTSTHSYAAWAPLIIAPTLILLTLPVARAVARSDDDPLIARIVVIAVILKLLASMLRYYVAFEVYGGSADAAKYIDRGWTYAEQIRQGNFTYDRPAGGGDGTHFIRQVTGWILAVIGLTPVGSFLVFSWMGFLGLCLFYRSFRIGVPHGDARRYAYLVFFLPSLLFWPSSVGKEAWMVLTLGLAAFGAARLLTHHADGYVWMVLGMVGSAAVRPHMTALVAAALPAGFLLRRSAGFKRVTKLAGAVIILAALLFAVQAAESKFNVEGQGLSGVEEAIDGTVDQTSQGGSEYEATRPDSLRDVPLAIFTVMFRPLPHEAHNMQALLTSFEGVFLLALVIASRRRLRTVVRHAWENPYVAFVSLYSLLFMLAFSSFGNFGLLARQRAQLFPFVLVLLTLPQLDGLRQRRGVHRPVVTHRSEPKASAEGGGC